MQKQDVFAGEFDLAEWLLLSRAEQAAAERENGVTLRTFVPTAVAEDVCPF